jgi:amidase
MCRNAHPRHVGTRKAARLDRGDTFEPSQSAVAACAYQSLSEAPKVAWAAPAVRGRRWSGRVAARACIGARPRNTKGGLMPSANFSVEEATIEQLHEAMREGELTARSLVETYRQRIEDIDRSGPKLNSILAVNDEAEARAAELDEALSRTGELSGALHGIPVLVKDCVETSEVATTFGRAGPWAGVTAAICGRRRLR